MRSITLFFLLSLIAPTLSFATQILDGYYDKKTDEIVLELEYAGGCGDHYFQIVFEKDCHKSFPTLQNATLYHLAEDRCHDLIQKTHRIFLGKESGVCRPSELTLKGEDGSELILEID